MCYTDPCSHHCYRLSQVMMAEIRLDTILDIKKESESIIVESIPREFFLEEERSYIFFVENNSPFSMRISIERVDQPENKKDNEFIVFPPHETSWVENITVSEGLYTMWLNLIGLQPEHTGIHVDFLARLSLGGAWIKPARRKY